MFDVRQDLDGMDADATLAYAAAADAALNTAEVAKLRAAAHWADLHAVITSPTEPGSRALPGCERLIRLGGAGPRRWRSSPPPSSAPCSASPPTPQTGWSRPHWTCGTGCPVCGPGSRPGK